MPLIVKRIQNQQQFLFFQKIFFKTWCYYSFFRALGKKKKLWAPFKPSAFSYSLEHPFKTNKFYLNGFNCQGKPGSTTWYLTMVEKGMVLLVAGWWVTPKPNQVEIILDRNQTQVIQTPKCCIRKVY